MWRAYSIVAPSLLLSPELLRYPFSVRAERKLSHVDIMSINRDQYQGTAYDLTKGIAAGPFGDPYVCSAAPLCALGLAWWIGLDWIETSP
jgi:dipeptidase